MASTLDNHSQLGSILVEFSNEGTYPNDEAVLSAQVKKSLFPSALAALSMARADLEAEIKKISQESRIEVDDWVTHTKLIQEDINKSRRLANSIVQQAEADEKRREEIKEKQKELSLLREESTFNQKLLSSLQEIQKIHKAVSDVERLVADKQFLNGLVKLQDTSKSYQNLFQDQSIRAVRLLHLKVSDLRKNIYEELLKLWKTLVFVDNRNQSITIHERLPNVSLGLRDVVTGLTFYEEFADIPKFFCKDLDNLILKPRTTSKAEALSSLVIANFTISLGPLVDDSLKSLLTEIKQMIQFLIRALPTDITKPLSKAMIPILSDRLLQNWLDQAVPSCIKDVDEYKKTLVEVAEYAAEMESINWPGFDSIRDWVENFPKIWLNKRKETVLEWLRNQITITFKEPLKTEKVIQKRVVDSDQIFKDNKTGATVTQEWNAVWDSDEDDDIIDAWGWGDEETQDVEPDNLSPLKRKKKLDMKSSSPPLSPSHYVEELPFEEYCISEWPKLILSEITDIYETCASLSLNQQNPVVSAAPGLLTLPTQILAMHRAISPNHYAQHPCGNLYRYNDSIWLIEKLKKFINTWKQRLDISSRIHHINKIDADLVILERFGHRAYADELKFQKSQIRNLLGGSRNLFREGNPSDFDLGKCTSLVISHIRHHSDLWKTILTFSSWALATGAMINVVATKVIHDVFDLSDISVDNAERTSAMISQVESLDNLFVFNSGRTQQQQDGSEEFEVPLTPQFADKWMKMKFLSEVLQSNLNDVKYLWFESDLSLYFSVDEITELIRLSFVMNSGVRQAIKEIKEKPIPKVDEI